MYLDNPNFKWLRCIHQKKSFKNQLKTKKIILIIIANENNVMNDEVFKCAKFDNFE